MDDLLFQLAFLLLVVSLHPNIVLVQLVLRQQVVPNASIQRVNLVLLTLHLALQSRIQLESFLKLQLQEGMFVHVGLVQTKLAVGSVHAKLSTAKLGQSSSFDAAVEVRVRLGRRKSTRITGICSAYDRDGCPLSRPNALN